MLVVWLNVKAGISCDISNKILQSLQFIISTILQLIAVSIQSSLGIHVTFPKIKIPQYVHTAYKYSLGSNDKLKIIHTVCCPKCYTMYSQPIPWCCDWKESQRSSPCNTELWCKQQFGKIVKWVPKILYNTQCLDAWLLFFLSRRVIEEALHTTFFHKPPVFGADMHDIHDSPAWKDLHTFL